MSKNFFKTYCVVYFIVTVIILSIALILDGFNMTKIGQFISFQIAAFFVIPSIILFLNKKKLTVIST